jgi:hypothetical protein
MRGGPQVLESHPAPVRPAGIRLAAEEDPGIGVGLPLSTWASGRQGVIALDLSPEDLVGECFAEPLSEMA